MDLRDYLRVLASRWRIVIVCVIVAAAAAWLSVAGTKPTYRATTQLFLGVRGGVADANAAYNATQLAQEQVKSYAALVTSRDVAQGVVDRLNLPLSANQVQGEIQAEPVAGTVLIDVSVTDSSAARAQAIANAVDGELSRVAARFQRPATSSSDPYIEAFPAESAQLPSTPVSPRPVRDLALAIVVGLAVGIFAAVARERSDRRVRIPEDVYDATGVVLLGVARPGSHGLLRDFTRPGSELAVEVRRIRAAAGVEEDLPSRRLVVFTGADAESPAAEIACLFAVSAGQQGHRVALVDADVQAPAVHEILDLDTRGGLSEVTTGRLTLPDALADYTCGQSLISVLAAPPSVHHPVELTRRRMTPVLDGLFEFVDLVVVAAPPAARTHDAAMLAQCSGDGAVVVVARLGRTPIDLLRRVVDTLRTNGATTLGVVLTRTRRHLDLGSRRHRRERAVLRPVVTPRTATSASGPGSRVVAARRTVGETRSGRGASQV